MSTLCTAPFSHTCLLSVGSILAIISYFENETISTIIIILIHAVELSKIRSINNCMDA